jgi:hypothetical protein
MWNKPHFSLDIRWIRLDLVDYAIYFWPTKFYYVNQSKSWKLVCFNFTVSKSSNSGGPVF